MERLAFLEKTNPHLAENLPLILGSAVFFSLCQAFSSYAFPHLLPNHFKTYSNKTKLDWDLHFTGWIHALISTPLSFYILFYPSPQIALDPVHGYAPLEGTVFAISGGYFLYDLLVSIWLVRTHGVPFVIHALSCCFIFYKAYVPFLIGLGPRFLIWETSTIFLHPHWWLDKLNMTGSVVQLVNGAFLMLAFFSVRVCYGVYNTIWAWGLLDRSDISPTLRWGFRAASVALCCLNLSWFRLMVISLMGRLKVREEGKAGDGSAPLVKADKGKKAE